MVYQLYNKDAKIVSQECNGNYAQVWAQNVILKLHQKKTLELCIIIFIFKCFIIYLNVWSWAWQLLANPISIFLPVSFNF